MIKLSKKVILLFMLVLSLFKQLVVGLSLFLFNRTLGSRAGLVICMGIIALALMLGLFVMALPSNNVADASPARIDNNVSTSVSVDLKVPVTEEGYQDDDMDALLAQADSKVKTLEDNLNEVDAFNFQVTEFSENVNVSIGRSEPFAPPIFNSGSGGDIMNNQGQGEEELSAEELAKIEAEKRREEIRGAIQNDINLKGIVYDENQDAPPMAIIEYMANNGSNMVKTVEPGDEIYLSVCSVKIGTIEHTSIEFTSEDVSERKHLPAFDDEDSDEVMVSDDLGSDDLAAPPTPGGGDDSSITDAKKKIEEIDKLLDSF